MVNRGDKEQNFKVENVTFGIFFREEGALKVTGLHTCVRSFRSVNSAIVGDIFGDLLWATQCKRKA